MPLSSEKAQYANTSRTPVQVLGRHPWDAEMFLRNGLAHRSRPAVYSLPRYCFVTKAVAGDLGFQSKIVSDLCFRGGSFVRSHVGRANLASLLGMEASDAGLAVLKPVATSKRENAHRAHLPHAANQAILCSNCEYQ